jgi:hypothetical protein
MQVALTSLVILFVISGFFNQCSDSKPRAQYNVEVTKYNKAADGLDLKSVGTLLEKSKNATDFETLLNSKDEGINNLDLNQDNIVDYIKVTEYGDKRTKGFSLTTEVSPGEEQEIATIEVEKANNRQANVNIHGNQQIYGNSHHNYLYSGVGTFLLMSYLFSPHSLYASPYGWGRYPNYYNRGWATSSSKNYSQRTANYNKTNTGKYANGSASRSNVKSPNANKSSNKIKAGLSNPSRSQKSFQTRQARNVRSGGFGSMRSSNRGGGSSWGK